MSKIVGVSTLCGQEAGLPWDNATAGRESGGFNLGHKLAEEVGGRKPEVDQG